MPMGRPLVAMAMVAGVLGCSAKSSATAVLTGPHVITVKNLAYDRTDLSVKVGDTVTWVFRDGSIPHNVDGASDLNDFSSGDARTGGTYAYLFKKAGSYAYHCDVHPSMKGTINVT